MPTWPFALGALTLVVPYAYVALRGKRGITRAALLAPAVAVALTAAFFGPEPPILRLLFAMMSFLITARLFEVAFGRVSDPAMLTTFPRFVFLMISGPDPTWSDDPKARSKAREDGVQRVARGVVKLSALVGMLAMNTYVPELHEYFLVHMFWVVWAFYFLAGAIFDLASGIGEAISGVAVEEMLKLPPLASSPRDFWSRRWNMAFRNLAHRLIFDPVAGPERKSATLAVILVFLFSGVVHEYLVIVMLGYTGWHMMAFFALHGLATLVDGHVRRRYKDSRGLPRPLAVALHMLWITVSSWLFFEPILKMVPLDTIPLIDLTYASTYGF